MVIIYKYLQEWKKTHDGAVPSSYAEKKELAALIRSGIRSHPETNMPEDEVNFEEAIKKVNTVLSPRAVGARELLGPAR